MLSDEIINDIFLIMVLAIVFLYFVLESYFEKNKPRVGHTTGVIVGVGMLASLAIYLAADTPQLMGNLRFEETLFFDLILPMIIFPSGYNMRRKKFFRNIKTIMKFGFVATMICFSLYSAMTYFVWKGGFITKFDAASGGQKSLEWSLFEILSICSLLCSSDVIAAISMINYSD